MQLAIQQLDFEKKPTGICLQKLTEGNQIIQKNTRKNRDLERTEQGCLILNQRNLKLLCQIEGLYEYPQMNKKLYLHYKVIDRIYGLEKYVNLKTLYLQNNVIRKIQNLDHLTQLENLFLQNNMIKKMEGLDKLKELKILNLSNNNIFIVEGLDNCSMLQNLTLSKNYLSDFASLEHLGHCTTELTSIDLSDNKIVADQKLFGLIPQVKCLYLGGNPFVRETKHYRRLVIGKLLNLMYLDQRGVDSEERMMAQAWVLEGEAGFKAARQKIMAIRRQKKQEQREQIMKNIDVHRRNKINVFEGNILDAEKQIEKLRGYMRDPNNSDQVYFYEYRIAELMQKIRENQQFIDAIYKRMGLQPLPPVYSIELEKVQKQLQATETEPTEVQKEQITEVGQKKQQAAEQSGRLEVTESQTTEYRQSEVGSSLDQLD